MTWSRKRKAVPRVKSVMTPFPYSIDLDETLDRAQEMMDLVHLETYVVDLSTPLDAVLLHMAREHIELALVVKEERLAGIFTLTDACKQFAECLRALYPPGGGDEAA